MLHPSQLFQALCNEFDCIRTELTLLGRGPSLCSKTLVSRLKIIEIIQPKQNDVMEFSQQIHLLENWEWSIEATKCFLKSFLSTFELLWPKLLIHENCIRVPLYADPRLQIKVLKSICQEPFLVHLKRSTGRILFRGSFRRWYQRTLRRGGRKAFILAETTLQLKRVCPKVPQMFKNSEILEWCKRLLMPDRQPQNFINSVVRESRRLLKRFKWSIHSLTRIKDFSRRGCVERKRHEGGIFGANAEKFGEAVTIHVENGIAVSQLGIRFPTVSEFVDAHKCIRNEYIRRLCAITEPLKIRMIAVTHCFESPLWSSFQVSMRDYLVPLPENFSGKDYDDSSFHFLVTAMRVMRNAGLDPVMVSDDGSAATDSICHRLTNEVSKPLVPDFLREVWEGTFNNTWYTVTAGMVGKRKLLYDVISWFIENDPNLSFLKEKSGDQLEDYLILHDRQYFFLSGKGELGNKSLFNQSLKSYLDDKVRVIDQSGQVVDDWFSMDPIDSDFDMDGTFDFHYDVQVRGMNGQPMGDRRSFVLLSVIHHCTKKSFVRMHRLDRFGVQLFAHNGDDGLIVIPRALVPAYKQWMSMLWGLNDLKTWVSNRIFSFNSQTYIVTDKVRAIGKVRWNLIQRVDKYGEKIFDPTVWNSISESLPQDLKQKVFNRYFLPNWKYTLDKLCRGGNNYFLPKNVGGLGLDPSGLRFRVTPRQYLAVKIADYHLSKGERPRFATGAVYANPKEREGRNKHKLRFLTFRPRTLKLVPDDLRRPGSYKGIDDRKKLKTRPLPSGSLGNVTPTYLHHWKLGEGFGELDVGVWEEEEFLPQPY